MKAFKNNTMKHLIIALSLLILPLFCMGQINIDTLSFINSFKAIHQANTLIAIGEGHQVKNTYQTEYFIISQVLPKGYQNILIEGGVSEAIILNEYLKTGDESLLFNTRARGEHYKKFIQSLYQLHQAQGPIHFIGVDFERSPCLAYLFQEWFQAIDDPSLSKPIKELRSIQESTSAKKMKKIILSVKDEYDTYEQAFQEALGPKAGLLKSILFNPVFYADFGVTSKKRDEGIAKNLLALDKSVLNQSILIFGSNHFTNSKYFWTAFKQEYPAQTTLLTFAYKNCSNLIKDKPYNSVSPLLQYVEKETTQDSLIQFELIENATFHQAPSIIVQLLNQ